MARRTREIPCFAPGEIEVEMARTRSRGKYNRALRGTMSAVIIVAALAVLIAALVLPVIRVTGNQMQPGYQPGDVVVGYRTNRFEQGDVCAFYFNNKLILKRIIAEGGDVVEMDEEGHVIVNGFRLDEDAYVSEYVLGQCDLDFPFEVPLGQYFVMGDNRYDSADSRMTNFGCITVEEMVGKMFLRVWPIGRWEFFGF